MQYTTLLGEKIDQTQKFLENGMRVPVSIVKIVPNLITQIKSEEKEGYWALQLGVGHTKKPTKALEGHTKKAGDKKTPRFLREVRVEKVEGVEIGGTITIAEVFEPGDIIQVAGRSKGKGYAGVVKRHHFKGGPKTHGQSDRERAPGSIGQTTTPGRVYKGKRMAGKMGNEMTTIKNLMVLDTTEDTMFIKGLIPGVRGGYIVITKTGKNKKYVPLFKVTDTKDVEESSSDKTREAVEAQKETVEAILGDEKEEKVEKKAEKIDTEEMVEAASDKKEEVVKEVQEDKKDLKEKEMKDGGK